MDFLQITEEVLSTQDPTLFWRLLIPILVKEMILHYLSNWVGMGWVENRFLGWFCKDYVWWRKVATLENSLPVWVGCCMKSRNDSETYLLCILLKVVFNQFAPKRTNKTTFYPFFSVKKTLFYWIKFWSDVCLIKSFTVRERVKSPSDQKDKLLQKCGDREVSLVDFKVKLLWRFFWLWGMWLL